MQHPIQVARRVLEKSSHCIIGGAGSNAFAKAQGFKTVDRASLVSPWAVEALEDALKSDDGVMKNEIGPEKKKKEKGTVGAVAVDSQGNIAAATSTGGLTNKAEGRIGDTPIVGAGVYANKNEGM